jgi:hypothetical protein
MSELTPSLEARASEFIRASGYCYRPTSGEPLLSTFMASFAAERIADAVPKWVRIETEGDLPADTKRKWITFEDDWNFGKVTVASACLSSGKVWCYWDSGKPVQGDVLAYQDYQIPEPYKPQKDSQSLPEQSE